MSFFYNLFANSETVEYYVLGCDTVWPGRSFLTCTKNILRPSSRTKKMGSKQIATIWINKGMVQSDRSKPALIFFFTARIHTTKSTVKILAANTHCKYFLKIAEHCQYCNLPDPWSNVVIFPKASDLRRPYTLQSLLWKPLIKGIQTQILWSLHYSDFCFISRYGHHEILDIKFTRLFLYVGLVFFLSTVTWLRDYRRSLDWQLDLFNSYISGVTSNSNRFTNSHILQFARAHT
jgi:hypothetical protein